MSNQDVAETFDIVWTGSKGWTNFPCAKGQLLPAYDLTSVGNVRASRVVKAEAAAVLVGRPVRRARSIQEDAEMCQRRARGVSLKILAADYRCSIGTVCEITKWR